MPPTLPTRGPYHWLEHVVWHGYDAVSGLRGSLWSGQELKHRQDDWALLRVGCASPDIMFLVLSRQDFKVWRGFIMYADDNIL